MDPIPKHTSDHYTDEEWSDIRSKIDFKGYYEYRVSYALATYHKIEFYTYLTMHYGDGNPVMTTIAEALYGDLSNAPLYINSQPGIVNWRLRHNKQDEFETMVKEKIFKLPIDHYTDEGWSEIKDFMAFKYGINTLYHFPIEQRKTFYNFFKKELWPIHGTDGCSLSSLWGSM